MAEMDAPVFFMRNTSQWVDRMVVMEELVEMLT